VIEEIETFGELGFDYLELAMDPPEAHHLQLRAARATIRKALDKYRMGLVCHLPTFIHTADLTPGIRRASQEELRASIAVAAHLGARRAVLHPSCIGGMGRHAPGLAAGYARQSLDAAVAWAARANIDLCLENLFPPLTPFGTLEDWDQVFARYPALGLTLDIGHAHIASGGMAGVLVLIARFESRLRHLHVSDNRGRHDDHLPIGDGRIDFAAVAEALHRVGYRGGITLEIFTDDRRDLLRSRERLAAILTNLR
jgi:sugar phosphate isomerase/epimerase